MQKQKKRKSPILKIGSYLMFGIVMMICVVMFLPTGAFQDNSESLQGIYASVNGDQISEIDFTRHKNFYYRNMASSDPRMERRILDDLIYRKVRVQFAEVLGVKVSDQYVKDRIKSTFVDDNKKFSEVFFQKWLNSYHMSISEAYNFFKDELMREELEQLLSGSLGASVEEAEFESLIANSTVQIKYAFISKDNIKKMFKKDLSVTEKEIDEEIKKNPDEVKDAKKDRAKVKRKLENKKLEDKKKNYIEELNKMAANANSFNKVASKMQSKVLTSQTFKVGEPVKEMGKKGRALYSLADSDVFREQCLSLEAGKSSKAVDTYQGIYVFTTIKKDINHKELAEKDIEGLKNRILGLKQYGLRSAFIDSFYKDSKILRYENFSAK